MKARVTTHLNIRTRVPAVLPDNNPGYYKANDIIEIAETVTGEKYKGNNVWYKLSDGGFVWSGGVENVKPEELLAATKKLQINKDKLLWPIKKFAIDTIWQFAAGEGVKVAVFDTGVDVKHPELKGAILPGYNFCNNNNDCSDWDGHGTHCAGIIAAKGIFDVVGVAPNCKIIPVKIMNFIDDGIDELALERAIEWVIGKADIVSMSGGKPEDFPVINAAIKKLASNNIHFVAAIGNNTSGSRLSGDYPALYPSVVAVGAINENSGLSEFTIKDNRLSITCPGENIKSTGLNGSYTVQSGTSMATPFMAGIIALYISKYKKASPIELKEKLMNSADILMSNDFPYKIINPLKFFS